VNNTVAAKANLAVTTANKMLEGSLARLATGLRINSAGDDSSGMSISDSLALQKNSLGQAIKNSNDAIGLLQISDAAIAEQVKILQTIKIKATQAAADSQTKESRLAIQSDIEKLMLQIDNIANTTSYNGMSLLSGSFTNKDFQVGAYSWETIGVTIQDTTTAAIGSTRFETTKTLSASVNLANSDNFIKITKGNTTTTIAGVKISHSATTGMGALAEAINRVSDVTGVRARATVITTASAAVAAGSITGLSVNGVIIGDVLDIKTNDADGKLTNAINSASQRTGVTAAIDNHGRIVLSSLDGRGIEVLTGASRVAIPDPDAATPQSASVNTFLSTTVNIGTTGIISNFKIGGGSFSVPGTYDLGSAGGGPALAAALNGAVDSMTASNNFDVSYAGGVLTIGINSGNLIDDWSWDLTPATAARVTVTEGGLGSANMGISTQNSRNYGRLTLVANSGSDIIISSAAIGGKIFDDSYEATINLRSSKGSIISNSARAIGAFANLSQSSAVVASVGIGVGVTSRAGAMMMMDIADTAIRQLDNIRANLGSTQNQILASIKNATVAKINIGAAESQLKSIDYAEEISSFTKTNILIQAASYASTQANTTASLVTQFFK